MMYLENLENLGRSYKNILFLFLQQDTKVRFEKTVLHLWFNKYF